MRRGGDVQSVHKDAASWLKGKYDLEQERVERWATRSEYKPVDPETMMVPTNR